MLETWKPLEFTNNNFKISNYGRIKFLDSKPYENKPSNQGYVRFTYKNKTYFVHRLVADLFCEKKEEMYLVDHINSLRNDNRAENLRWVNHSINNKNIKGCNRPIIK